MSPSGWRSNSHNLLAEGVSFQILAGPNTIGKRNDRCARGPSNDHLNTAEMCITAITDCLCGRQGDQTLKL